MSEVTLRLNSQGTETTIAEIGNGATVSRISPRDAKKIQDFADNNRVDLPRGRQRTDEFGNTRSGLDIERNVPLQPAKPFVRFRPRS